MQWEMLMYDDCQSNSCLNCLYLGFYVYWDKVDNISYKTLYEKRLKERFSIKLATFSYFKKAFHLLTIQDKRSTTRYQGYEQKS